MIRCELAWLDVLQVTSNANSVENICERMNQAMKTGTLNEMKSDFSTAWHGGRSGVYPLE